LHCGTKYYDLRKAPATCPKCGTIDTPKPVPRRDERMSESSRAKDPDIIEDLGDIEEFDNEFEGEFDTELDGDFSSVSTAEDDFSGEEEEEA
jgi:hypothetical protein